VLATVNIAAKAALIGLLLYAVVRDDLPRRGGRIRMRSICASSRRS
jgi:hypothetical protein